MVTNNPSTAMPVRAANLCVITTSLVSNPAGLTVGVVR